MAVREGTVEAVVVSLGDPGRGPGVDDVEQAVVGRAARVHLVTVGVCHHDGRCRLPYHRHLRARLRGDQVVVGIVADAGDRIGESPQRRQAGRAIGAVVVVREAPGGALDDLVVLHVRMEQVHPPVQAGVRAVDVHADEGLVVVLSVHQARHHKLLDIVETRRLPGLLPGLGEDGEQDGRQDRDDRDDDQQLDEREALASHVFTSFHIVCQEATL